MQARLKTREKTYQQNKGLMMKLVKENECQHRIIEIIACLKKQVRKECSLMYTLAIEYKSCLQMTQRNSILSNAGQQVESSQKQSLNFEKHKEEVKVCKKQCEVLEDNLQKLLKELNQIPQQIDSMSVQSRGSKDAVDQTERISYKKFDRG